MIKPLFSLLIAKNWYGYLFDENKGMDIRYTQQYRKKENKV